MESLKKCFAEFIGTFVLVFFGCGTAVVSGCAAGNAGHLITALAFGLVIVAMAYSVGNVSGCHVNPAVSIGCLVAGRMTLKDFALYIVAQFVGAIAGAAALKAVLSSNPAWTGLGTNNAALGTGVSIVVEIILTCVFVFTILGVTSPKESHGSFGGLVIGLTLTLIHLLGIPFTGTSVNPARSFGPALIAGGDALSCVWIFVLAPLIGGALAAVLYKAVELKK
ncbi:MAG: MIP family channel protein [Treponema sp.]|nr:MIP family channel protein [Treponema sp.]MBR1615206.1 MIP family channel protein [Treponema sp.]